MLRDTDLVTRDVIQVLNLYETPAIGGVGSNLYLLALNNIMNIWNVLLAVQARGTPDYIQPSDLIAERHLLPVPTDGTMRLMSDEAVNEILGVRKILRYANCCDNVKHQRRHSEYFPVTIGMFKEAFRTTAHLLSSTTTGGIFYQRAVSQAVVEIENKQRYEARRHRRLFLIRRKKLRRLLGKRPHFLEWHCN
jgi:hypothetical protein